MAIAAGITGIVLSEWWLIAVASAMVALILSFVIHEAGHSLAFRLVGDKSGSAVMVNNGARGHLVRIALPPCQDLIVVISGPLAPLGAAFSLIPLWFVSPVLVIGWIAIAVGHALVLLVPTGDGANLRQILRLSTRDAGSA